MKTEQNHAPGHYVSIIYILYSLIDEKNTELSLTAN